MREQHTSNALELCSHFNRDEINFMQQVLLASAITVATQPIATKKKSRQNVLDTSLGERLKPTPTISSTEAEADEDNAVSQCGETAPLSIDIDGANSMHTIQCAARVRVLLNETVAVNDLIMFVSEYRLYFMSRRRTSHNDYKLIKSLSILQIASLQINKTVGRIRIGFHNASVFEFAKSDNNTQINHLAFIAVEADPCSFERLNAVIVRLVSTISIAIPKQYRASIDNVILHDKNNNECVSAHKLCAAAFRVYTLICDIIHIPLLPSFIECLHEAAITHNQKWARNTACNQQWIMPFTLNIVSCLGGHNAMKTLRRSCLLRHLHTMVFALRSTLIGTQIYVSEAPLECSGIKALITSINFSSLRILRLVCCRVDAKAVNYLSQAIQNHAELIGGRLALQILDLSSNTIGDTALCELLNVISNDDTMQLRELHLHNVGATSALVFRISALWCTNIWRNQLRVLSLEGLSLGKTGSAAFVPAVAHANAIRVFSVSSSRLHTKTVFLALDKAQQMSSCKLRTIDVSSNYVSYRGAVILGRVLSQTTSINDIVLKNTLLNRIKLTSILSGIASNPHQLFRLDIALNSLRAAFNLAVKESLRRHHLEYITNIQFLNLASNGVLGFHASHTCAALIRLSGLEVLCIDDNASVLGAYGADDGRYIANVITHLPSLRQLSLRCSPRRYLGDKGTSPICTAIAQCSMLMSLDLSGTRMAQNSYKALANSLSNHSNLITLCIDKNQAQLHDWHTLLPAVQRSSSLCFIFASHDLKQLRERHSVDTDILMSALNSALTLRRKKLNHLCFPHHNSLQQAWYDSHHQDHTLSRSAPHTLQQHTQQLDPIGLVCPVKAHFGEDMITYPKHFLDSISKRLMSDLKAHTVKGIFMNKCHDDEVKKIREELSRGAITTSKNPNAVAKCLLNWLGEMPIRLLDNIHACGHVTLAHIVEPRRAVCVFILDLCLRIARNAASNNMYAADLASAFAPYVGNVYEEINVAAPLTRQRHIAAVWERLMKQRQNMLASTAHCETFNRCIGEEVLEAGHSDNIVPLFNGSCQECNENNRDDIAGGRDTFLESVALPTSDYDHCDTASDERPETIVDSILALVPLPAPHCDLESSLKAHRLYAARRCTDVS